MSRRGRIGLSDADRALWQRMTADIRPLANRPTPPQASPKRFQVAPGREHMPELPWRTPGSAGESSAPVMIDQKRLRKLGRGHEEVDSVIDLHGSSSSEAHLRLARHIAAASARGERIILAITGKGGTRVAQTSVIPAAYRKRADFGEAGVLRRMLPLWLEGPDLAAFVAGYARAHHRHGGDGAFYILLRRLRPSGVF